MASGPCDYLLLVDGKACGVIEAKPEGSTLSGVADQSSRYQAGAPELAVILRETFVELYQGDPLAAFREEVLDQLQHSPKLADKLPPLPDQGDLDLTAIRAARYMFA